MSWEYSFYPFYRQLSCFLQLSVTEVKLEAMEEERDILKSDQENSNAAKDELIKKAWDVRDAAVKRKNNTEIELARTRIDLMQVNSQLLEAIQQKVELSQQLGMTFGFDHMFDFCSVTNFCQKMSYLFRFYVKPICGNYKIYVIQFSREIWSLKICSFKTLRGSKFGFFYKFLHLLKAGI